MIRVLPHWCDAISSWADPELVNVDACIAYLVNRGWLNESATQRWALVFEGCGVADAECRMVCSMFEQGFTPAAIVFLDKKLSTGTIENVRNLPARAHVHTLNNVFLTHAYAHVNEFLRTWSGNVLVLGVHARYSFATAAEEEPYKEFCELCARGNVQPECVNFKAKPLCSRPVPSFHPIDEKTDTWVYHETWQSRVQYNTNKALDKTAGSNYN